MIRNLSDLAAIAAVSATLVLGACGGDDGDKESGDTATEPTGGCPTGGCPTGGCPTGGCPTGGCPTMGGVSGFVADYATNAGFFTLMAGPFAGTSPHGTVQIWYTTDLQAAIESGDPFTAPVGAASIKEFDNGAQGIVVMTKQAAGFDADNGDWYYELLGTDGTVQVSGAIADCIACHEAFPDTDYLGGTLLR
jgi:hypothetical protein